MKNLNQEEFNHAMDGYFQKAWEIAKEVLANEGVHVDSDTMESLHNAFAIGLYHAKDTMTIGEAIRLSKNPK